MNRSNNVPLICCIIGIVVIVICFLISGSNNTVTKKPTTTYTPTYTTPKTTPEATPKTEVTWKCVDVTSYDRNGSNDNKCTSSEGETRYVSDSVSRRLDPSYTPSTRGGPSYNY